MVRLDFVGSLENQAYPEDDTQMTASQREACLKFAHGKISEDKLFAAFGKDFRKSPNDTMQIMQQALDDRSSDDVDFALGILFRFWPTADCVPLLCELLVADFHHRHEDIIDTLNSPAEVYSVPFLRQAILLKPRLAYLAYDDYGTFYMKCFSALRGIATPEAVAVVREFTTSEDLVARKESLYWLSRIEKDGR